MSVKKEKHLDIKGKEIKIGDVVVVHKAKKYWSGDDMSLYFCGCIGIVKDFGCVKVELCNTYHGFNNNDIVITGFYCDYENVILSDREIEVIGKL